METAASIETQGLNGHSNELLQLDPCMPSADSHAHPKMQFPVLSSEQNGLSTASPANRPQSAHQNGDLQDQTRTESPNMQQEGSFINFRITKRSADGGLDDGSQTERVSRDIDMDTNNDTPNYSMTSASFLSAGLKKSTSPSNPIHTLTPASSFNVADSQAEIAKYRPRSSIPSNLSAPAYAQQCIAAAYASRLNPYALHKKEQEALQDHLCHLHVTVYLNIRNGILRLWTRNPLVSVSKEEALGCAKDYRWMNLASFAYEWLARNAYINFG